MTSYSKQMDHEYSSKSNLRLKQTESAPLKLKLKPLFNFFNKYDIMDMKIGVGSSCVVKKCIRKSDNICFALKIVTKRDLSFHELQKDKFKKI